MKLFFFFFFLRENKVTFYVNCLLADNSHELFYFLWKKIEPNLECRLLQFAYFSVLKVNKYPNIDNSYID